LINAPAENALLDRSCPSAPSDLMADGLEDSCYRSILWPTPWPLRSANVDERGGGNWRWQCGIL